MDSEFLGSFQTNSNLSIQLSEIIFFSGAHKFVDMADDLHEVAEYLSEIRICFILLTGNLFGFFILLLIFVFF